MSPSSYEANLYPGQGTNPTIANANPARANIGVCFSGGGSRALTCAWGQMIGLQQVRDASGASVLDRVRYISSVSGGSWAAVAYTYLPDSIPDTTFLPPYTPPKHLYLGAAPSGGVDVSQMAPTALGVVPQRFANLLDPNPIKNVIADFIAIVLLKQQDFDESLKWLWLYIVGTNVLAPFGLYGYRFSLLGGGVPWDFPSATTFSLSAAYAAAQIFDKAQHPPASQFQFVTGGGRGTPSRPLLIVNTNIVGTPCSGVEMMGPLQVPVQITAVSGGSLGANPCVPADVVAGGSVETYALTSTLQSAAAGVATTSLSRVYGLADITACSSAFYAATLAENLRQVLAQMLTMKEEDLTGLFGRLLEAEEKVLAADLRVRLAAMNVRAQSLEASDLVPQYNYWPVASASTGAGANALTLFTDGGDLENTGVVGLLAQTDVQTIIAFVAASQPLEKSGATIVVSSDIAPLFGMAYSSATKSFQPYQPGGINPFTKQVDPMGFLQVFDNSADQFDALAQALYAANGSGTQDGPAFCRQSLTVMANPLAGVAARSTPVTVLWAQNARVNDWQNQIVDPALTSAIAQGQTMGFLHPFADFPCYSTFTKVHQTAAETNALAQMWAWCTGDPSSPLTAAIRSLVFPD